MINKLKILIDSNNGRLGNQLFPILTAISIYFENFGKYQLPILFKNDDNRISKDFLDSISPELFNLISFDSDEFQKTWESETTLSNLTKISTFSKIYKKSQIDEINTSILLRGYFLNKDYINECLCRSFLRCRREIKEDLINRLGKDVENSICLHVRRGDYLSDQYKNYYISPSSSWIRDVILTYFPDKRIICISDDIDWCKKNLVFDVDNNIIIDFFENSSLILDFWLQTITLGNICSCSTFSLAGAILNPNMNAVIATPYYKDIDWEKYKGSSIIIPNWMKQHPIKD